MISILLVEDDISLIDGLVFSLEKNKFQVDVGKTVKESYCFINSRDKTHKKNSFSRSI